MTRTRRRIFTTDENLLCVCALAFAHTSAFAADPWSTGDTVREVINASLLVTDWAQTRYAVQHPCGQYEFCTDPNHEHGYARYFISEHPTLGQVDAYFAASIVLHAAISYVLPRGWRDGWQYGTAVLELRTVIRNHHAGIDIGLSFPI
jgi:hypothetical protein